MATVINNHVERAETRSGIPSDDGTLPIRRRSPGEVEACVQGYQAAIADFKRHVKVMEASATLAYRVNL